MSECVVRMEMPKGCGSCPVANFGYCSINHKPVADSLMGYPKNRPANCPIICSLPEGHGRLVDADAMKQSSVRKPRLVTSYDYGAMATVFMDVINDATTIVPAERREG